MMQRDRHDPGAPPKRKLPARARDAWDLHCLAPRSAARSARREHPSGALAGGAINLDGAPSQRSTYPFRRSRAALTCVFAAVANGPLPAQVQVMAS